ncbi:MAG: hypothetical protein JWO12_274 [Frankiales bacterium]|nr:hypothetical protein [Frankiales bacterium]
MSGGFLHRQASKAVAELSRLRDQEPEEPEGDFHPFPARSISPDDDVRDYDPPA